MTANSSQPINIDLMKLASKKRKGLKFLIKYEGTSDWWVFGSYAGFKLSPVAFQDFITKWASYKGNVLPPFAKLGSKENEETILQWYDGHWDDTKVNTKTLTELPEIYFTASLTPLSLDEGSARITKLQDGSLGAISQEYLDLYEHGHLIAISGGAQYQVLAGGHHQHKDVKIVIAGIRPVEKIEDTLREALGLPIVADEQQAI